MMGEQEKQDFIRAFRRCAMAANDTAIQKGWYGEDGDDERNMGEVIALMHSELSEALESYRRGDPMDDKIPQYSGIEAEFADVIIRIMDTSAMLGYKVAEAIVAKMEYNTGRPYRHGGKLA